MTSPRSPAATIRQVRLAGALLALAVTAAYATSLANGFAFDDGSAILHNPTIRTLADWRAVLSPPPRAAGATGRPLVNLTLALNYALGGLNPRGYHLANLAIHLAAALILFGLLRRTLSRGAAGSGPANAALPLAAAIALLWALHPLVTESVSYVIQRSESLMGLFFLLTLYAFVRAADNPGGAAIRWRLTMVGACLAGVLTKEVMVAAPVVVLLYDRTFVSGAFREAWRRHGRWHLALAATWLPLGWLVAHAADRGGTAGFGLGISARDYALTQCQAIAHYLRLAVWPHPLVADYGTAVATRWPAVAPQALVLAALFAATTVALGRRPAAGFAGAWFFIILAPTSSVLPITTQTMAEHRMYLPLIPVVAIAVLLVHRFAGRRALLIAPALALALGWLTAQRNLDYRDELTFWRAVVAARPGNLRAHNQFALALETADDPAAAETQFHEALRLDPGNADVRYNLGTLYANLGRDAEATHELDRALRLNPGMTDAQVNLGNLLLRAGRPAEALDHFSAARRQSPRLVEADMGVGNACLQLGRLTDAMAAYRAALRLDPRHVTAFNNLGTACLRAGRYGEAVAAFDEALRLDPGLAPARQNRAIARRLAAQRPVGPEPPN